MAATALLVAMLADPVPSPVDAAARARGAEPVEVAPGVLLTTWTTDAGHGPVRLHLLTIDQRARGVSWDVVNTGSVAATATVLDQANAAGADVVAAVNGDFYDIGRTGAPLGVTRSRDDGLWNARSSGWNSAFYETPRGRPEIGTVALRARIPRHPDLTVTHLNSHLVAPDGIGAYTPRWGDEPGEQVLGGPDGEDGPVRRVAVRDGVVVTNGRSLKPGRELTTGFVLIGRGSAARALRDALPVGTKARLETGLTPRVAMAVTGDRFLVDDGVVTVVDNTRLAPRTAVGIDRDTRQILVLVADGRRQRSRGLTMVELANVMIDLGAEEALNLDGGGSTTLVTRGTDGALGVRNTPSDGFQRRVANSLVITYRQPGS